MILLLALVHFSLFDTLGVVHQESEWAKSKAVVIFFTTTDCPISNGYVPEMNRIYSDYAKRGVAFYAVQGDRTIADAEVKKHAKEFGFKFPVLFDPKQVLVRLSGATAIPEAVVLSSDGKVLYLGRIDNRIADIGQSRIAATEPDLRNALESVLAGKAVAHPRTTAVGCAITLENR